MSTQFNLQNNKYEHSQGKVKVTDLLTRLNDEKKIEKKKKYSSRCCSSFSSDCVWNNSYNIIFTEI